MLPVSRRFEIRQREDAQQNNQSASEERFPHGKNAIGLDNHSQRCRANSWHDSKSKVLRQHGEQGHLQCKKTYVQKAESHCSRRTFSKQFCDRRIDEYISRRHVSSKSGRKRVKRVGKGSSLGNADGNTRNFSGLLQIICRGTSLRRKGIDRKTQAENDECNVCRGN